VSGFDGSILTSTPKNGIQKGKYPSKLSFDFQTWMTCDTYVYSLRPKISIFLGNIIVVNNAKVVD
jgi:hypothetical protein